MGTKRTPVHRQSRMRITPEAVELFQIAERHRASYRACIGGGPCRSRMPHQHCAECRNHIEVSRQLHRALGLKPWEACPLDVSPDQSAWPRDGSMWAASLDQAKELRAALEAAALNGCAQTNSDWE